MLIIISEEAAPGQVSAMRYLSTSSNGVPQNLCCVLCLPNKSCECKSHTSVIFKQYEIKNGHKKQQKYVGREGGACHRARPSALSVAAQAEFSHQAAAKKKVVFLWGASLLN